jgi:ribosomal protein L31E
MTEETKNTTKEENNKKEETNIEGTTKEETKKEEKKTSTPAVQKNTKKKEEQETKPELTREYVVPLRKGFLKVPQYKRAKKAVKTLKEFIARHMRVENRDLRKIKIDLHLNNEIWFRGIKKPANKIKVKATKKNGIVTATLAEEPDIIKFHKKRIEKRNNKATQTKKEKKKEEITQHKQQRQTKQQKKKRKNKQKKKKK